MNLFLLRIQIDFFFVGGVGDGAGVSELFLL